MNQENLEKKEVTQKTEKRATVEPEVSQLVSEVISVLGSLGLTVIKNKGYCAFKIENRNIFSINKLKSKKLQNIIKIVFTKELEEFPADVVQMVSPEKISGFYCVNVSTIEELQAFASAYLEAFKG